MDRIVWDDVPGEVRDQLAEREAKERPEQGTTAIVDRGAERWYFSRVPAGWNCVGRGDAPGHGEEPKVDEEAMAEKRAKFDSMMRRAGSSPQSPAEQQVDDDGYDSLAKRLWGLPLTLDLPRLRVAPYHGHHFAQVKVHYTTATNGCTPVVIIKFDAAYFDLMSAQDQATALNLKGGDQFTLEEWGSLSLGAAGVVRRSHCRVVSAHVWDGDANSRIIHCEVLMYSGDAWQEGVVP